MSLFDLTGKVALVTGSSRGIGRAIALRMAEHGARVVISSRKRDACEAVVAEIEAAHGAGRAVAIPASISVKAELEALVAETETRLGPVDVLVCNAASNPYYGPLAGISDDQFRKILDNNVAVEPLADPAGRPRHGRPAGRRDRHRLLHRGAEGLAGDRRLQRLEGGRPPARPQLRGGVRAGQRAGELPLPGPDPHRFRPGAVGGSRDAGVHHLRGARCAGSASPTRSRARRCSWPPRPAGSSPARRW